MFLSSGSIYFSLCVLIILNSIDTNRYWSTVAGTLSLLDGLVAGFNSSECAENGASFSLLQALYMNAWGDLYTIQTKYALEKSSSEFLRARRNGEKRTRIGYPRRKDLPKELRCSSMWKVKHVLLSSPLLCPLSSEK